MILVIAEQRDGTLNRASWEAIAAGQHLAAGAPVVVGIAGSEVAGVAAELAAADVAEVIALASPALATYTRRRLGAGARRAGRRRQTVWVVLPHTYQTRDFAPALAARAGPRTGHRLHGDHAGAGQVVFSRPMFQGKLAADVRVLGDAPDL